MSSTLEKAKQELNLQGKWAKQYEGWSDSDYWIMISMYPLLTEDFIARYKNNLKWDYITVYQTLSENFIREHQDKYSWGTAAIFQKLSNDFIREFNRKFFNSLYWQSISCYQVLSESFIKEFNYRLDQEYILGAQVLSENFIRELDRKHSIPNNSDVIGWMEITSAQRLSESFIEEFQNKINWYSLAYGCRELSEDFIRRYKERLNTKYDGYKPLVKTQKISLSLARELGEEETFLKYNTSRVTPTEWKQIIADTKVFECFDDYFYAYTPISNNNKIDSKCNIVFEEGKAINHFKGGYERNQFCGVSFESRQKAVDECTLYMFDINDSKYGEYKIALRRAEYIYGWFYSASMKIAKVKINYEDVTNVNKKGSPYQAWHGKELKTFYYDRDEIYCKKFKVEKIEDIKSEVVNI